jgi:serine kinase of HPr protein (carbohydrate metabolism regulator)
VTVTLHGTVVAWHGRGVLIRGQPGAGKSDLALRLIAMGALLVADDQVMLMRTGESVHAAAPTVLAGLLEVRGVGLCRLPYLPAARVALLLDLVSGDAMERLPDIETEEVLGLPLPVTRLRAFECSAAQKVAQLLRTRRDF